jgi:hypothetical protein
MVVEGSAEADDQVPEKGQTCGGCTTGLELEDRCE